MPYLVTFLAGALLFLTSSASAQVVLQDFETGLKYDECYAGDNVGLSTSGVPLQGVQRLQTGPLNKNKPAYYLTPYISMRASGLVRFKHRNESNGNKDTPVLEVDLVATDGTLVSTIYSHTHTSSQQPIVAQPPVPSDGTYRVRFRFEGDSGNERVGLDELNIDGTLASAGPPQCGPLNPSVEPPVARPDAAQVLAGASVVVPVLNNDEARTLPIDVASVDLQPESTVSVAATRDIRDAAGTLVGRAFVDRNGLVTVSAVTGFSGTLTVPYSVRDTEGHVSNITHLVVTVQGTTLDLRVVAIGPPSALVGATVRYVTAVTNLGPGDAAAATFTFVASAALGSVSASCPATRRLSCGPPQVSGDTVTIGLTDLPAGTSVIVQLSGVILGGQGAVATVESRIAANGGDIDTNPGNDTSTVTTQIQTPPPGSDVLVAIDGPDSVVPGLTATYTTTVLNNGPGTATNVQLGLTATGGLSLEINGGDCTTAFPCVFGDLAPGAARIVTSTYRTPVPQGTIAPLPPVVVTAQAQAGNDIDTTNNTASIATTVNTSLDVAVSITPDPSAAPVGSPAEIFVLAHNAGPNPARNFSVLVAVPSDLTVVSATPTAGSIAASGVWSIPEVLPGAQVELRLVLIPTRVGDFGIQATATPPPTDSFAGNDQATAVLIGEASADIATRLVTSTPTPPVGGTAQMVVYAGNFGPTAAPDARLTLTLPAGLRVLAATPSVGAFNSQAGVWAIGRLGAATVISMPVTLGVDSPGTLPVTAVIEDMARTADLDLTNNTHTLAFGVTSSADLAITLAANITAPVVGQLVSVRAVVLNGGPSTSPSTTVVFDAPPGALSVVSVSPSIGSLAGNVWSIGTLNAGDRVTLDVVIRVEATGAIPISGVVSSPVTDPAPSNNTASVVLSGAPDYGQVEIDFEDLTGSESCWAWPGMAPGGITAAGLPFGRWQANPPQQLLVQLVSSQLSGGTNRLVSPWIEMFGAGAIRFTTKVTNVTSAPHLRVYLEDVAARTPVQVFDKVYPSPPPHSGVYDTIPITASGIYRVRWEFTGSGGNARAAIDDIVIDGQQLGGVGLPGRPVRPIDCDPDIPGNLPPIAAPDFAVTAVDTPVTVFLLANDVDLDGTLNPAFVDLDPAGTLGEITSRDIYRGDGVLIGRASYSASGPFLTFTPASGVSGTAEIPYTVQDDAGEVSNIALVTILVGTQQADLEVAIDAPATANPSTVLQYRIRVRNLGRDAAVDVALTNVLSGTTVLGAVCTVDVGPAGCGTGAIAGSSFSAVSPGLANGAQVTWILTASAPGTAGLVTSSATVAVAAPVNDPNPSNNTASAVTAIGSAPTPPRADLTVAKTGPVSAAVGQRVGYTVVVANLGPNDAGSVTVSDPTPPGFVLLGVTGDCATASCRFPLLAAGQDRTMRYEYLVLTPGATAGGTNVTNTVTVASPVPDPQSANNSASVVTRVFTTTDLAISASQSATGVVGQPTTIVFSVTNAGPSPAGGVEALITLPPGLVFSGATPTLGSFDPATGLWSIGALLANGTADLRLTARIESAGPLTTTGIITGGLDSDTDDANNATDVTVTGAASADVGLTSSADNTDPLAGDIVTFTLQATNAGPSAATGLGITGVLPSGLTYLSHTVTQGSLDTTTGLWTLGGVSVGGSETLTVQVRVERGGVFNSSATITAHDQVDLNQANNATGVLLNAGDTADVGLEIRAVPGNATLGDVVAISVLVGNAGPSDGREVVAAVTVSPGLRVTGFTVSTGNVVGTQWHIPLLARGATAQLDITAVVEQLGSLDIAGVVTHAEPDPNPVNDAALASVNASGTADLRLSMVAGTRHPLISDNATVFVVVTNEGDVASAPVEIDLSQDPALLTMGGLVSAGSFAPTTRRWSVGSIQPGGHESMAYVLRVTDAGLLPVFGTITSPVPTGPAVRTLTAVVSLEVLDPLRTVADLQLEMTASPTVTPGGTAVVAALASNAGSTYAMDVSTRVSLPTGALFVAATPSFGASCTTPAVGTTGIVSCTWVGQSVVGRARLRTLTIQVQPAPGLPEGTLLTADGEVSSLTVDPFPMNNRATASTVLSSTAIAGNISLTKAFDDGTVIRSTPTGSSVGYRVTARNTGAAAATGIAIVESVPAGAAVVSAVASQGTLDGLTSTWVVGDLAPGAAATLDVVLMTSAPVRADLPSSRVAGTYIDGNPIDDRATITLDVFLANGGGRFVASGNIDATGAEEIITGTGFGEPAQLRVFGGDGTVRNTFYPFDPRFEGGVRVASCDIDRDGRDEIVAGAGPGGGPHIRLFKVFPFDRIVELTSFYAFPEPYRGGVYVACGDVTGDGVPEVIAGSGSLGAAVVKVFEVQPFAFTELFASRVFSHAAPEARVAVCDLNGDGRGEVLAASGPGAPTEMTALDPLAGAVLGTLRPFPGATTGAFVACGDLTPLVNGPEVVVSGDAGGPPVMAFYSSTGASLGTALVAVSNPAGGVRAAVGDVDPASPGVELLIGSGIGAIPVIRVASGSSGVLTELRSVVAPNVP